VIMTTMLIIFGCLERAVLGNKFCSAQDCTVGKCPDCYAAPPYGLDTAALFCGAARFKADTVEVMQVA